MKEYWEENLHALSRTDLIKRLKKISGAFLDLNLPEKYKSEQLLFITDPDFKNLMVELSKEPLKTLNVLRAKYEQELVLLYYYDPLKEHKKFQKNIPEARINPIFENPEEIKKQQIKWLTGNKNLLDTEGLHEIDERGLRMLVKKGMIYLKEVMESMGLDYSRV